VRRKPTAEELRALAEAGDSLSVRELRTVLEWLRLPSSENTIRRWITEDKIDCFHTKAGKVRIDGAEVVKVIAWLREKAA